MDLDFTSLITSGAIVIFLTQQAKRWIPSGFLPLIALLTGIVIQVINDVVLATEPITAALVWIAIVTGAGIGMTAAGVYDLAGRAGTKIPPATISIPWDEPLELTSGVFSDVPAGCTCGLADGGAQPDLRA